MSTIHFSAADASPAEEPLISNRLLVKVLVFMALMAVLTGGLVLAGHWLGHRITLAGHTDSREKFAITIGRDQLLLPANVLRFEAQRRNGVAERADLYLMWPEMDGFSREKSDRFNDLDKARRLIFVQITQSVMSRDMSGRIQPIYSHYFKGDAEDAGNGLKLHRFAAEAGYQQDALLTAARPGKPDYAVRCVMPPTPSAATAGDCQRDIVAGNDLSVLYRFSSDLLPDWEKIDTAVGAYVAAQLARPPEDLAKMR